MASLGHEVLAFDVDYAKIQGLANGTLPFYEPELGELLSAGINSGKLRFTTDLAEAIS
jgi:UDPglucose 6-dehydrogenase